MYGRALAREISTDACLRKRGLPGRSLKKVKKQGIDSHAPPNISLYDPKGGIWSKTDLAKKTHLSDESPSVGHGDRPEHLHRL